MAIEGAECADAVQILVRGAHELSLRLAARQCGQFVRFCEVLCEANAKFNLTAVRSPDGVMRTLFLDSLALCTALPEPLRDDAATPLVVDVGSGAGIPGLPLKIVYPHWRLVLVESVGKKARFLQAAVQELSLSDVTVLPTRAEELGRSRRWRDAADLCVARAVAPMASLVELCAPLVRAGGLLSFPKGGDVEREVLAAQPAMKALGVRVQQVVPVPETLGLGANRSIALCEKLAPTPPGYPRRVGLARSRPIGS